MALQNCITGDRTTSDELCRIDNDGLSANPDYNVVEKPWLPGARSPYLIVNAKLVDPRAGIVHHDKTLHLAGGRVVRVAPTTQQELTAEIYCAGQREGIDASRYFVCPGLIDCHAGHVHIMAVHGSPSLQDAMACPDDIAVLRTAGTVLKHMFANGFTTVRDTGGATIAHSQATAEFFIPNPRVFQGTSGGIASPTDQLESIQFTVEGLQAITTVNKNMGGTLVTAHCYTSEGVRHAVAGGVGGIEHGNMTDLETAQLMARNGVFLTPTLALHTFITMPPYNKFQTPEALKKNAIVEDAGIRSIRLAEEVSCIRSQIN